MGLCVFAFHVVRLVLKMSIYECGCDCLRSCFRDEVEIELEVWASFSVSGEVYVCLHLCAEGRFAGEGGSGGLNACVRGFVVRGVMGGRAGWCRSLVGGLPITCSAFMTVL